jgi:hypothetical protein
LIVPPFCAEPELDEPEDDDEPPLELDESLLPHAASPMASSADAVAARSFVDGKTQLLDRLDISEGD